ncbi:MAG: pentapeptide repeat-containing protein [Armatimonadetes bacterium]|nr:pentapeptide repeat-containing protein [Armatimonadota bacterium]
MAVVALVMVFGLGFVLLTVTWDCVSVWSGAGRYALDPKDTANLENAYRDLLLKIIGGLFVVVTAFLGLRSYLLSAEAQGHQRFNKACEQLESSTMADRLRGISELERIAQDTPARHWEVMEILQAHLRSRTGSRPDPASEAWVSTGLPEDVRRVILVFRRRRHTSEEDEQSLDLSDLYLTGADFRGAHLQKANLNGAHLEGATFREAHLEDSHLERASLEDADLTGAHLDRANLRRAHLDRAMFWNAHLENAFLFKSIMVDADLTRACLDYANLRSAQAINAGMEGASLRGANCALAELSGANLTGAHLSHARLPGAQLDSALMEGADMQGADLGNASLYGAYLQGAQLQGCNLREAVLEQADLSDAVQDVATVWPAGFKPSERGVQMANSGGSRAIKVRSDTV